MAVEESLSTEKRKDAKSEQLGIRFYRFLFSNSLASISFNLFFVFFMWKVVSEYHSVFLAGFLATIFLIVQLISSVPIGHIIDRFNNTVLNTAASIIMAIGFSLFIFGFSVSSVYVATVVISLGYTLKGDTLSAIIKKHVKEEGVSKATSYQQASNSFSSLTGLVSGGVSLVFLSHMAPFILLAVAVTSTILSWPVSENKKQTANKEGERTPYSYRDVFSFFRKIIGFIILALILNGFFISLDVYGAGLFNLYLHAGPFLYTLFVAIIPAGSLLGSILSNRIMHYIDKPAIIAVMTLIFAPILITLGISRSPMLDITVAGILGFILPLINVPLTARMIKATPSEIFGKVFAFLRIFLGSSTPVMATLFSFASIFFSLSHILMIIGTIMIPVSLFSFGVIRNFYATTKIDSVGT